MQPVRGPIGSDVSAVPPNGSDLLSSDRLPHTTRDGIGGAPLIILYPTPPSTANEPVMTIARAIQSFFNSSFRKFVVYAAAARTAICRAGGRNTLSSRLKANTATAVSSITAETGNRLQAALA